MIISYRKQKTSKNEKYTEGILHIFILLIMGGMALYFVKNLDMMTDIGLEDIYLERARFLSGQKLASRYSVYSLCSIGYSFVLLPFCLFFKSSYATYKIVVLLNTCFLYASYLVSFKTVCRWFREEKRIFLLLICFMVTMCPVFLVGRIFVRPDMMVMFLIWVIMYLLTDLWESSPCHAGQLAVISICLILISFLNIAFLGVIVSVVLTLIVFVKKEKVSVDSYLVFLLVLLLGMVAGNVIERIVQYFFFKDKECIPNSSFFVLINCIEAGWEKGRFLELLRKMIEKLYIVMVGSFMIILPGVWFAVKKVWTIFRRARCDSSKTHVVDIICLNVFFMFFFQIVLTSLCDNSGDVADWFGTLRNFDIVLPVFVLFGLLRIKNRIIDYKEMMGYFLFLCGCTYIVANISRVNSVTRISKVNSSIFTIFMDNQMQIVSLVYFASCMVILVGILLIGCWQANPEKTCLCTALHCVGVSGLLVIYFVSGIKIYNETAASSNKSMGEHVSAAASLISDTQGECWYLKGTGHDNNIVVLQSLIPKHEIKLVENSIQEREELYTDIRETGSDVILITGVGSAIRTEIEEELPEFRLLYMTDQYALWADQESDSCAQIQNGVSRRIETPALKSNDDTVIKYNSTSLPSGTYRLEVYLQRNEKKMKKPAQKTGTLTVSDSTGTIQTLEFSGKSFDQEGNTALVIEFTSKNVMENVEFRVEGSVIPYFDVENIYYWQLSPEYTIGQNHKAKIADICSQIRQLDEACGTGGSITFVENVIKENERVSVSCFEEFLPSNEVMVCSGEDVSSVNSDYLISVTDLHLYFPVMDRYSIIYRDNSYTILVKNGTDQYNNCYAEENILSDGTNLFLSAFERAKTNYTKRFRLEKGTYSYHFSIESDDMYSYNGWNDSVGTIFLYNGKDLITQKKVSYEDMLRGHVEVSFVLRSTAKQLNYKYESESTVSLNLIPESIELVSQKYQYGMEEESISEITEIVNMLGDNIRLVPIVMPTVIEGKRNEYSDLEKMMPGCRVYEETLADVNASTEDRLVLIYNLSTEGLQLLSTYSIIGHAGQYTLLARNDGELLEKAVSLGICVWNSGKKVSPESISRMSELSSTEDCIAYLPYGKYKIVIQWEAAGLEPDDTVELSLMRAKTEDEISKEQEKLIEQGYTKKQAKKMVDSTAVCGSVTLDAYSYADNENSIVSIQTSSAREFENLTVEGYTWHGIEVTGKILWIEIV